jgi:hypothetical protein
MIGAPDMAFPRMNNLSFWLFVAGASMAVVSLFTPGGNALFGTGVGWVLYPPLSTTETGMALDLAIFAVHLSGPPPSSARSTSCCCPHLPRSVRSSTTSPPTWRGGWK